MKITDKELLLKLSNIYKTTGEIPKKEEVSGKTTYIRRFGSWNKALIAADIPVRVNREEVISVTTSCEECGKLTTNPKFCSKRCVGLYNTKHSINKVAKEHKCLRCDTLITGRNHFCITCRERFNNQTIQEVLRVGPDRYREIRARARLKCKDKLKNGCSICGYKTHVEVHHLKAISDFPLDTLISVVNAEDNLAILCRNHHWELGHGLLSLTDP